MIVRALDGLMAALFALAALAQYNDPFPGNVPWMLTYAAGAVLCGLAAARRPLGRAPRPFGYVPLVLAAGAAAYALFLLGGAVAAGESPFALHVRDMQGGGEAQREAWGLLILAAYTAWLGLRRPRAAAAR